MFRVGQTNVIARYPIHFHMMTNVTNSVASISDCAVHRSYFRCYAIHGTSGAIVSMNTAYDVIGHCYFLEDGVEENNTISYNQAAHIHILGPFQVPSQDGSFWGQNLNWHSESDSLILPSVLLLWWLLGS